MMKLYRSAILFMGIIIFATSAFCQSGKFEKVTEFYASHARQGIAVDDNYFYVVGSREIGKYEKETGKLVTEWQDEKDGNVIHLDSGVIVDSMLYCSHSNYPGVPMTSSVEIWNAKTLEHIGTHSFGIQWGSCTWIDKFAGYWWAGFAHYGKWTELTGTDEKWTTVVKFNSDWHPLESWVFPEEVSKKFIPMSNSGGSWGPDSLLYCTGHDGAEVYVMKLPEYGSVLVLVDVIPVEIFGQGIAWDRSDPGMFYGIIKDEKKVVVSRFHK